MMKRGRATSPPLRFQILKFLLQLPILEEIEYPSMRRPSRPVLILNGAVVATSAVVALLTAGSANWDLGRLLLLLAFAVASDQMAMRIRSSRVKVSGSFLAIVVAMVLLGGAPAAVIGV